MTQFDAPTIAIDDIAGDYLERLLDILDVDGDIDLDVEGDRASVAIVGGDLSDLVGPDGAVLEALQELTRLAVAQATGVRSRLMLDISGFRARRRADLTSLAGDIARGVALTSLASGIGFAIATIGRNTAIALGVGFGYIVIVENLVRGLRPGWSPWLLTENAGLFLIGDPADFPLLQRSVVEAGIYLTAVATLLLVAAAAQFRVRDVTV